MIVHWKRISAMEYRAQWQGMSLSLEYKPAEHRWRMFVDFRRVRQTWTSTVAAFNAVEAILSKMMLPPVVAPLTRTVVHG